MREKKLSFVIALWWCIGLAMLGGFLLALAPKESRESDSENRMLAGFPKASASSLLDGTFMSGLEDYLSDGFFNREAVVAASEGLMSVFDMRTSEDVFALDDTEKLLTDLVGVYGDEYIEEEPDESSALPRYRALAAATQETSRLKVEPTPTAEPKPEFDPNVPYTFWLNKTDGGTTQIYDFPNENIQAFADNLNLCRSYLPEDGVLCFAQVPVSSTAFRWTHQRNQFCGWGSNMEEGLSALVDDGVRIYNVLELLAPGMEQREALYFTTDHHWTPRGAYYVYAKMITDLGYPALPYDEYAYETARTERAVDGKHDPLEILYPLMPTVSKVVTNRTEEKEIPLMAYARRSYVAFLNSTQHPWRRIITGYHTGRKALVICDSFGNVFAPYLLPHYDEVHMTDPRNGYYSLVAAGGSIGELIGYFGIDDVYVILSTTNGVNSGNGLTYFRYYLSR